MNDKDREEALEFLARLGAQPAVAYHEAGVASVVRAILDETGIEYSADAFGNILARLPGRQRPGQDSGQNSAQDLGGNADVPPLAIVAHMDHPGFELTERHGDDGEFVANASGGIPASSFAAGVPLQVIMPSGLRLEAVTCGQYGEESERKALVRVADAGLAAELPLPAAAVFDLPDFQLDGEYIRMRAVDDLAGCASALAAMARLVRSGQPAEGDVYALFTRAEEVGLVGAMLAAESRLLPQGTLIVSAESSRTLPGAEQGLGPVIRVGDRGSTFDADAESVLVRAQEALNEREGGFASQRQLMSGGVCEASAFAAYGYRTTGIAFPLGNYHNGAPEGGIEAEYIRVADFLGGVALMEEAARRVADRVNTAFRRRLQPIPEEMRRRLLDRPA